MADVILVFSQHTFAQEDKQHREHRATDELIAKPNMLAIRHATPAVS
jgi:hypothetical protein